MKESTTRWPRPPLWRRIVKLGLGSARPAANDGTTVIEFAILAPVFMMLLLGIVEFGRLLWTQVSLQQAVEAGARCAVVQTTSPDCSSPKAYAASQMLGMSVSSSIFTLTSSSTACNGVQGYDMSASLPFTFIVSGLFPWRITLTANSCRPY